MVQTIALEMAVPLAVSLVIQLLFFLGVLFFM
jgi:hypothetical protein